MLRGQKGVSLIELMVALAIVGILATVAIFAYKNYVKKARVAEVHAVMHEMRTRQEQFQTENGFYLSTGIGEGDTFPASADLRTDQAVDITADRPPEWDQLKIQLTKNALWCGYVTIAGAGGDGSGIGAKAAAWGLTTPATNWFYILAECPFNNTTYIMRFDRDQIHSEIN